MVSLADFSDLPIWVAWKIGFRDGKETKVPYDARTGQRAAVDNPATWATRPECEFWTAANKGSGIGIVLCEAGGVPLAGVDLDVCRNVETGKIEHWAQIVDRFRTYGEVSPSGSGIKLFFVAPADEPTIERLFDGKYGRKFTNGGGEHGPAIEIYRGNRYFTVTGDTISDTNDLRQVGIEDLAWLIRTIGSEFADFA
jgi:putative DNA primase/helicase